MKPSPSLFYIAQTSTLLTLLAAYPATAQIIPDNTVNTKVTPNGNINVIEGGTRAGTNLFHSFQEFSVPTGREAFFNNAFDIRNIFSRVTGKLPSNIDGLIRANGTANLFLLNPNGIIFGPNARLNIGGSFLATTANSFKFADGTEFSATNPQTAPLLSINVPIGLQMGSNPGNITVNGTGLNLPLPVEGETLEQRVARGIAFEQEFLNNPQGLLVQPGKTIGLVGGNLTFNGGLVTVRQGRIEIGSVNSGVVNLNPSETGFVLGYENISSFGEIQMSQSSAVTASGEGAGEIRVRGGKITLNEISSIGANTIGNGNGKSVTVEAEQLSLFGGSFLVSGTFSSGDAGNLIVKAKDSVEVNGISVDGKFPSTLQTFSLADGKAGNLTIDTGRLIIRDGAFISTGTSSKGQGGNLNIQASQEVQVNGTSTDGNFRSALATPTNSAGNAGDMTIQTGRLIIQDGAFVSTRTSSNGEGGNLTVRASQEVKVSGTSANGKAISLLTSGSMGREILES
jgi:filamentous hemagglutinin family protein